MSEHTKAPWWTDKEFNTCWYCASRIDAGHNISGTPHYCAKDLSTWDGEEGNCSGYTPDDDAIMFYKTKSLDAKEARAEEVEQQRDELLAALKRAERKLTAYVGVCKDDKELTEAVLPMARAAIANVKGGAA